MRKTGWRMSLLFALVAFAVAQAGIMSVSAGVSSSAVRGGKRVGTVTGSVRDSRGNPLAGALVSVLREGAEEVVKYTRSAADGTFKARIAPGRYLLRAVADGFNAATFTSVQINPSSELVYRFNLEPVGQGRTAPERRADRDDPKFRIRASHSRRSIFQIGDEEDEVVRATERAIAEAEALEDAEEREGVEQIARGEEEQDGGSRNARMQGVVETFFVSSDDARASSNPFGLNFALANNINENLDLIFAGQFGATERLEATALLRLGTRHRMRATLGGTRLQLSPRQSDAGFNALNNLSEGGGGLGQFSVRAVDEWVVRDGIVVVVGLDYSRFVGAGGADSFTPRFGVQYDANARTRLRAAYAAGGEEEGAQSVAFFEDAPVVFRDAASRQQPVAVVGGRAVLERSRRLEFGVERVLGESSSVEATAFFDTTDGRGVGLMSLPLSSFAGGATALQLDTVADQQGAARGMRIVYTRRVGGFLKASAGYSFGRGQQLSPEGLSDPDAVFQDGFFHTAAAQVDADVRAGTRVRTVLRFSPNAAVFAIDPFAGRLAVYDPSLSILVTQELPTFGLPLRAQAVLDARNVLDVLNSVDDGEAVLAVGANRRTLRGGISVRF